MTRTKYLSLLIILRKQMTVQPDVRHNYFPFSNFLLKTVTKLCTQDFPFVKRIFQVPTNYLFSHDRRSKLKPMAYKKSVSAQPPNSTCWGRNMKVFESLFLVFAPLESSPLVSCLLVTSPTSNRMSAVVIWTF